MNHARSKKRRALGHKIWAQIQADFQRLHHRKAASLGHYSKTDGFYGFVVMWDHWQQYLVEFVCARGVSAKRPLTEHERRYMWDESEDEDGGQNKEST